MFTAKDLLKVGEKTEDLVKQVLSHTVIFLGI